MSDIYKHPAEYDLEHLGDEEDVDFYVSLVRTLRPQKILELGCGTGRITLPLAIEGASFDCEVIGLDSQPEMLKSAEQHRESMSPENRGRLRFLSGDMRTFSAEPKIDLIVIPCSSMSHVLELDDQIAVFKRCYENLNPGGRFVVEVTMPNMAAYADSFSVPQRTPIEIDLDRTDESDGTRLIRRKTTRYLSDQQLAQIRFLYEKYRHGRGIESNIDDFASHVFFPRELALLFIHAGFEIERTLGDYRSRPLSANSPLIIMIGKRAGA
jgi:ubiquinone/menaquinone biosynthesis C-methylase UbiE